MNAMQQAVTETYAKKSGTMSLIGELVETDRDLAKELIQIFVSEEPMQRRAILNAILKKERISLAAAAHCLRGSLCIFGAPVATDLAGGLESEADTIDFKNAYGLFEELERELIVLTKSLKLAIAA
jgi:HPt (histidine-containing phosphotransfer) domain-containing protein